MFLNILRAVAADGELAGVILFGHFPDAFVVRTCNWRKDGNVTVREGKPDQKTYQGVRYLRRTPEDVAHRADIVLADRDGRWEQVYVQPSTRLESVTAVYADRIPPEGGPCVDHARGGVIYEDFFHVSDGKLEIRETVDATGSVVGHALFLDDTAAGHECAADENARPNPIAVPDILVSRIDARGTALRPRADVVGINGEGLLGANGEPQAVQFPSAKSVPHWRDAIWELDPVLERKLLAEHLDRNHAFRKREVPVAWRPSSIACDLSVASAPTSGVCSATGRCASRWARRGADPPPPPGKKFAVAQPRFSIEARERVP